MPINRSNNSKGHTTEYHIAIKMNIIMSKRNLVKDNKDYILYNSIYQ